MPSRFVWRDYKRTKIIQHGSFATIYEAIRFGTSTPVAIKISTVLNDLDNNTPEEEASFLRALAHPHTIALLDTVPGPRGDLALVLEYCPTDLFSLLVNSEGPLPTRRYLKQLLKGVAHFHAHNTVHCDLKPENILVAQTGDLKICDFGFAETIGTGKSTFKGTIEFLAPEYIWDDAAPHSPPTDMWSVGCIFYMLLTRRSLPFATEVKLKRFSTKQTRVRYALERILVFLDPFPVQPSRIKPYPPELVAPHRKFKFFVQRPKSWVQILLDRGVDASAVDLLSKFWEFCPSQRISAQNALNHPFF
jgi:serine/threonine protein kinase